MCDPKWIAAYRRYSFSLLTAAAALLVLMQCQRHELILPWGLVDTWPKWTFPLFKVTNVLSPEIKIEICL